MLGNCSLLSQPAAVSRLVRSVLVMSVVAAPFGCCKPKETDAGPAPAQTLVDRDAEG